MGASLRLEGEQREGDFKGIVFFTEYLATEGLRNLANNVLKSKRKGEGI